jgi:hypothetical protein
VLSSALPIEIFGGTGAPAPRPLSRTASRAGNGAKDPKNQGFLRSPDHLMPADTLLAQANRRAGGPSGVARTLSTQITADVAEPIKARRVPCGPGAHQLPLASHILPIPVILAPRSGAALHFTPAKG